MTISTGTDLVWRASTVEENYNWVKRLSDSLTAIGLAKSLDTGQVDLSGTALNIPSNPDQTLKVVGYEIRKMVKAGLPTIYLRFDYAVRRYVPFNDTALNNTPVIKITVGTSTDGNGALGGARGRNAIYSDWGYSYSSQLAPYGTRPFFFSSDGESYLTLLIDPALTALGGQAAAAVPLGICIERSINRETADYDGAGYEIITTCILSPSGEPVPQRSQVMNIPTGLSYGSDIVSAQVVSHFTSSGSGGTTTLFPISVALPEVKGPMKSALFYYTADIATGYQFSANVYGALRNYIAVGTFAPPSCSWNPATQIALRFD